MKQLIHIVMLLLMCQVVMAQTDKIKVTVEETTGKMSQGYNKGMRLTIPNANQKDVERDFVKFMKQYDAKGKSTKGEYFFDNAVIKQLGNNPVDVYSIATGLKEGVQLDVFVDLGGAYLNATDHPDKATIVNQMLSDFGRQEAKEAMQARIDAEMKILDSKMKEQDDLVRDDSSLHKKIRDARKSISDSEEAIKKNEVNQSSKRKEIEDQKKIVDALKSSQAGIE